MGKISRAMGAVLLSMSMGTGCQVFAGDATPAMVRIWHSSYLVQSNVGSSSIYAMSADGAFKVYRPSRVDANEYPCAGNETSDGYWCVDSGRLYQQGSTILARSSDGTDVRFYLDEQGRVCAPPDEAEGYEGQCEDEGREEAMGYFAVYPRQ